MFILKCNFIDLTFEENFKEFIDSSNWVECGEQFTINEVLKFPLKLFYIIKIIKITKKKKLTNSLKN